MLRKEIIILCLLMCVICSISAVVADDGVDNLNNTLASADDSEIINQIDDDITEETDNVDVVNQNGVDVDVVNQKSVDVDVVKQDNNLSTYSLPNTNDKLQEGEGSFSELQDFINSGGTDIILDKNYTYDSGFAQSGISITRDVTIDGQGKVTLDALNQARIFNIAAGTSVTLKGITFVNANANGHGGSIVSMGIVSIEDCKFIDSTTTGGNGGSVFLNGAGSTITNSYFEGSRAIRTEGSTGVGGAVFIANSNIQISHSTFINNNAGLNGGAVGSKEDTSGTTIVNCTFENNAATGSAGAVGMQSSNFRMYNSTFKNNTAKGLITTYPGNGGGIVLRGSDSYVYNSTFINNTAAKDGGATYLTNTTSVSTNNNTGFELCTFIDNAAGNDGGAVNWISSAYRGYVIDSIFTNNLANRSGGAVYWSGHNGIISNCTFIHNNATGVVRSDYGDFIGGGDGGAILWIGSNGIIRDNCKFTNNYAKYRGGAIFLHGTTTENCTNITVSHSSFDNNYAGMNGGAIDWNEGSHEGNIIYSTFTNNAAGSNGGAVFWSGHDGEILYSNFTGNEAKGLIVDTHGDIGDGGAVIWTGLNGTVDHCRFIDNVAAKRGGAAYLQNCSHGNCENTTFSNSYFKNNTAGTNGGAIDWHEGAEDGHVINSVFEQNTAKRSGGAIYWNGNTGEITNSNFTNNKALGISNATDAFGNVTYGGDGGAVIWIGSDGIVDNCRFVDNVAAKRGGAVYLQGTSKSNCENTTFKNSYFKNNTAGTNGGAIDWNKGAHNGLIDNAQFIDNVALRSGGAVYWNGEYGQIRNSNFTRNKAKGVANATDAFGVITYGGDGGAVIWIGHHGLADNCRFIDNEAAKRGGAVYLQGTADANCTDTNFTNVYFKDNVAGTNGGAVDWNKGAHDGLVDNATFINNTAKRSGGAIYWNGNTGTIQNSNFTNNKALGINNATDAFGNVTYGGDGGAVIWIGSDGEVKNCRFVDNEANKRGGAVYLQGTAEANCSNTNFTDSYFEHNTAGTNGGAIDWNKGAHNGLIDNAQFIDNVALRSGGAVYWNGEYGQIRNSNFTRNKAKGVANATDAFGVITYGGDGGAVIWIGHHGLADNCRFIDNEAAKRGGAVYLQGTADANCTDTNFTNVYFKDNVAGTNGGAVDWNKGAHDGLVDNATFINNTAKRSGGAIYWNGNTGTIQNSNFTNNKALGINNATDAFGNVTYGGDGGAVIWIGSEGTVDNCNFIDNEAAKRGGAVYLQGTAEANCTDTSFLNSYFRNNTAGTNGGAIDWNKGAHNGIVDNVQFINNTAKRSGGAIYWNGHNGTIQYSHFYNNKALGSTSATTPDGTVTNGGDGGAIIWTGAIGTVNYSNFVNNTAAKRGGAVFLQGALGEPCENTTFKNSYFRNNVAGTNGGAVDWYDGAYNGLVDNVTFINNTAKRNGGAIFWHGDNGTVKDSTFRNNRASGVALEYDMELTRDNIVVVKSTSEIPLSADSIGKLFVVNQTSGGIDHFESYVVEDKGNGNYELLKLDEIDVVRSQSIISPVDWATDQFFGGDGGTILWSGDIGLVYNCTFIGSDSARRGGAAYMTGSDNVTFDLCYFENSTSGTNGGGVDWLAGANYGKILNTVFNNTRAARSAGAIYYDGDYGEMKNITIINATSFGGSLKTSRDGLVKYAGWDSSHWDTNTTGGDAGAIMITGDYLHIYNATFTNCTSAGRGGAIFLQDNVNATIELCTFESNYAKGIANNTWANYTLERDDSREDTKVNYKLTGHGGAVAFDVNAKYCEIIDSKFYNNLARRNGGALNFDEGSTNNIVRNSEFINNTVYDDGGAINFDHGADNCAVYNTTFYNNTALGRFGSTSKGGTICLVGNNVTIEDSKFTLGIVYANIGEGAKDNETFGGAIFVTGNDTIIKNAEFTNCHSLEDGGALYVIGDNCKMYNSSFTNNSAGDDGGAIYW